MRTCAAAGLFPSVFRPLHKHLVPPVERLHPAPFSRHLQKSNRDRVDFTLPYWKHLARQNAEHRDAQRRFGGDDVHARPRSPHGSDACRKNRSLDAHCSVPAEATAAPNRIATAIIHTRIHMLGRVIDLIA